MDATAQKLLKLLKSDQPIELRRSAAQVLGEVGNKSAAVEEALCELLDDPDAELRQQAMTAAGKLRLERALPQLLARAREGGLEAEVAAQAAARLGARGIRALQQLMAESAPGLKRRLAGALAAAGTVSAEQAALDALVDHDPGVVDAAARSLLAEVPSFTAAQRRALADQLLDRLTPTKKQPALVFASETALVRLLSALGDSRGEAIFWQRTEPTHPSEVRAAALQALGTLSPDLDKKKLQRLLACAGEADFRIAAPALLLLKPVEVNAANWKQWLPLFEAPDSAARRFAIEKLGARDTPEVAAALLAQLGHPDAELRQQAVAALSRLKHGRQALLRQLLEADSPDSAWALARAQAGRAADIPAVERQKLFDQACKHLEKDDRRAEPLLFLLREADPRQLRDRLEERARALRKKKDYPRALVYLRLLGRDPACGEAVRFELAACGLKVSSHDLAADYRANDPALKQFARLVHSHETHPLVYLKQARWLEAEDLFYLGFHFAEGSGQERTFGAQVLRLLLERYPRARQAKDARSKLRREGLERVK
jgi:hypothetical protein